MSLEQQKDKIRLNSVTHSVRASQAVLQYGVGAMVDFPNQTLMTAAPEYWDSQVEKIHDERLEKALNVDYFGMPGNRGEKEFKEGISYTRFPEWYFCPKCRRFQPILKWVSEYQKKGSQKLVENDPYMVKYTKCPICYQELVVARIITACQNGHIDDFPWVKWVHCQNRGGAKKICDNPQLTFKTGASSTEGLEGLEIYCDTCKASATLRGAFDTDKFEELDKKYAGEYNFSCAGKHPWKKAKEACASYPRVLQRGSSSVYFPVIESSLVIPPYSSMITLKIEESAGFKSCRDTLSNLQQSNLLTDEVRKTLITQNAERIARETSIAKELVLSVLNRKWSSEPTEGYSTQSEKYRFEEYEALSGVVSVPVSDRGDFLREATDAAQYKLPFVRQISLIHKVREVQALVGFSRLKPADRTDAESKQAHMVPVKDESTNWYPAYQVRGEGIFIEFDPIAIAKWDATNTVVRQRIGAMNTNYKKSYMGVNSPRTITSKFVLLHTLSHLLIKQLSFECGYSIASLKERIYCSDDSEKTPMAGVLIYTASGDSEGTMGGLVRQGRFDVFPHIFKKAIEMAMTCSNDPVCSLSLGQGRDSLNMSACYSRTLLPETSCEEFNVFLDRGFVIGTYANPSLGFYSDSIKAKWPFDNLKQNIEIDDNHEESSPSGILIPCVGTDMKDSTYKEIWTNLLQWAETPEEQTLLESMISDSTKFSGLEKPHYECEFQIAGSTEVYRCDLVWKNSEVMFFTKENELDYAMAKKSNWTCFYALDKSTTSDAVICAIKER